MFYESPTPRTPDTPDIPDIPDTEDNLLYCNNNPDPQNICAICAADIGRVFSPGTEPRVPRHEHCYCYYVPTQRSALEEDVSPRPRTG